jgi:hypothetical protein
MGISGRTSHRNRALDLRELSPTKAQAQFRKDDTGGI